MTQVKEKENYLFKIHYGGFLVYQEVNIVPMYLENAGIYFANSKIKDVTILNDRYDQNCLQKLQNSSGEIFKSCRS